MVIFFSRRNEREKRKEKRSEMKRDLSLTVIIFCRCCGCCCCYTAFCDRRSDVCESGNVSIGLIRGRIRNSPYRFGLGVKPKLGIKWACRIPLHIQWRCHGNNPLSLPVTRPHVPASIPPNRKEHSSTNDRRKWPQFLFEINSIQRDVWSKYELIVRYRCDINWIFFSEIHSVKYSYSDCIKYRIVSRSNFTFDDGNIS